MELLVHVKVTYITCCYDGILVACRSLFVMGSDVVLLFLLLYTVEGMEKKHPNTADTVKQEEE